MRGTSSVWGTLFSLLLHLLLLAALFYAGTVETVSLPGAQVYNVELYRVTPPSGSSKRTRPSGKSGKYRVKKRVIEKPKNTILVSKRKERAKPKRRERPKKSTKRSKKTAKKRAEAELKRKQRLLERRLEELRRQRYLERRLEELRGELKRELAERKLVASSGGGGASVGIAVSGGKSLDPALTVYITKLVAKMKMNWVLPRVSKGLEAVVDVRIDRRGRAVYINIEKSSGEVVFDESCLRAVRKTFPFDPLPPVYDGEYLDIGVRFRR